MTLRPFASAIRALAIPAMIALGSSSALAAASFTDAGSAVQDMDTSYTFSFANGADSLFKLNFNLIGYLSVDGDHIYDGMDVTDTFSIVLNGTKVYEAYFDMGGGGTTYEVVDLLGLNFTTTSAGAWEGGLTQFSASPVAFATNAVNTLTFGYANRGTKQYYWDEQWQVSKISVTAVPEPETYAMLLAGLGMMGAMVRRRKQK
jgi:hypothetical protein